MRIESDVPVGALDGDGDVVEEEQPDDLVPSGGGGGGGGCFIGVSWGQSRM
jgi:hypothetical protein